MLNIFPRRRALLRVLTSLIFVSGSHIVFAQSKNDDASSKAGGDKKEPGNVDGGLDKAVAEKNDKAAEAKSGTTAFLTVMLIGDAKPIADAEVKVKFSPSVGEEVIRHTNQAGKANFDSVALGVAKIRVIVAGWKSGLKEVDLKDGSQTVTISLVPLP